MNVLLGTVHIWRPWKLSNFQDSHTLVHYVQIFSTPLTWTSSFERTPTPPPPPLIPRTNNAMVSLKDGFRVSRKISCQWYINVGQSMMSSHSANPIFFNKKKIGRSEHSLPPTSDNISFVPLTPPRSTP